MMRPFIESDLTEINSWYAKRGQTGLVSSVLPEYGAIEPGVGAAFLYCTEGGVGFLESYISNPDSEKEARRIALHQVTEMIVGHARGRGLKLLIGFCVPGTVPFARPPV